MDNNEKLNEKIGEVTEKVSGSSAGLKVLKEVFEWVMVIVLAVAVAFVIRRYFFTMVAVEGSSMDYTLADGDRLCVVRFNYTPDNGDIIVFNPYGDNSRPYIKRVIALGGQSIYINRDGDVFVDGEKLSEDYLGSPTNQGISFGVDENGIPTNDMTKVRGFIIPTENNPYIVPEGYVFAMGDNRSASHDCRNIGPVSEDDIVGRAVFRVYPFKTFGKLD